MYLYALNDPPFPFPLQRPTTQAKQSYTYLTQSSTRVDTSTVTRLSFGEIHGLKSENMFLLLFLFLR